MPRWAKEDREKSCKELVKPEFDNVCSRLNKSSTVAKQVESGKSVINKPITQDQYWAIVKELAGLNALLVVQREHIDLLEAQLETIEEKGFSYQGVWKPGAMLKAGDWITYGGSLWHVKRTHIAEISPGNCDHFTLAVKKGKDAAIPRSER